MLLHFVVLPIDDFTTVLIPITIDIASRDMRESLNLLALLGKLEHPHTAEVVDLESVLQRIIEVNGGRAVDYDIAVIRNELTVFFVHTEVFFQEVALYVSDLVDGVFDEVLSFSLASLEAHAFQYLVFDPL